MIVDHYLRAHAFEDELQFGLSLSGAPISIRDQQLRATELTDRLIDARRINRLRPLLVVGAGVAGISAAIRALKESHCRVTIVDRKPRPFSLQANCSTRILHPTQYDWPLDHWNGGQFPWHPRASASLRHPVARADDLADMWSDTLQSAVTDYKGRVTQRFSQRVSNIVQEDDLINVDFFDRAGTKVGQDTFGAVAWCTGSPAERVSLARSRYRGFRFWEDDPLGDPDFSAAVQDTGALISGSGDGALQDFLRVVTRTSIPKELYDGLRISDEFRHGFFSANDQAYRCLPWCNTDKRIHAVFESLHSTYTELVDSLWRKRGAFLGPRLETYLRDPLPRVQLAYQHGHFTCYYGLNRFLVLLVAKFLHERYDKTVLFPGWRLTGIEPLAGDHECRNPMMCHGQKHRAAFERYQCCSTTNLRPDDIHQCVVIRHGVKGRKKLRYSVLPYHVPW